MSLFGDGGATGGPEGDTITRAEDRIHPIERYIDIYEKKKELGRGKFGVVYQDMSIKSIYSKDINIQESFCSFKVKEEIGILKNLSNPHVIKFVEAFENERELILVMEYLDGGELFERVATEDFNLTESDCCLFIRQLCRGVDYLHEKQIVHLDLKPENVVCTAKNSNSLKIIDFGLAKKISPSDKLKVMCGTPEFVAPEVVNYDFVDSSTDMWSVGVICYILLSGYSPFLGDTDAETYTNISSVQYDFDEPEFDDISENAKEFIRDLLKRRKNSRMTAKMCLDHPWLLEKGIGNQVINTDNLRATSRDASPSVERLQQSDSASNHQQTTNKTDEQTTNSQEESLENVPSDSKTENPQTEKEENLPTIETEENSTKTSQDNIEKVDSHSRSNEEKTSLTSENVLDEVKVISENIEENTPAAIELSETVKQTAIENPIDEKSIEVEQTEEVKEATPLQSEGEKDSSEIKPPSENLTKKENASNVETEQTSQNIVVETDISAVTEANKDETLKEVAETKTKNENTSEKPENKRLEQPTAKTAATSSSGRSIVGAHRSAFEYGRNMTADNVGFRNTPPRTPEGVRRVNTQIFEGLPKEGNNAGTTATPPRSPQLDFKKLGLVSVASRKQMFEREPDKKAKSVKDRT